MAQTDLLSNRQTFQALQALAGQLSGASVEQLFAADPDRVQKYCAEAAGLHIDYSKHLLDDAALEALLALAREVDLPARAAALCRGERVNNTEHRSALHTLLRANTPNGLDSLYQEVTSTRERMRYWANRLNAGEQKGFSGQAVTDIVNIGIGGSDLGPRLVTEALRPFQSDITCHYVANVDPADLHDALANLNPHTTAFIICSKSFRTQETITNALAARDWLLHAGASKEQLACHFLAMTTNLEAAAAFGIDREHCLPLWDWVGGRYSVWSAVGLSCAIAVGWTNFEAFLDGARIMDEHFSSAPPERNLPMLLSLLELWYCNAMGAENHVVLPYDNGLQRLPDFLQQLTMESNGKRVTRSGDATTYKTGPVLWGSAGTMGQHSFHQLLHQGTRLCPVDFILPLTTHTPMKEQHSQLIANCLAQSRALMVGRTLEEAEQALKQQGLEADSAKSLAPHLAMPGNRPNSTISFDSLTPSTLGALLALYEHRTYCSGQLWGVNPFDQWGVELGKEIGAQILDELNEKNDKDSVMDASTQALISRWREAQN